MTRSEPLSLDRAKTVEVGTGVAAAPPARQAIPLGPESTREPAAIGTLARPPEDSRDGAARDGGVEEAQAEAVRRELARLTALLRRHFSKGSDASLLPMLADTSDPAAASSARAFLDQIRFLTESLARDADRWSSSVTAAGAYADFRRETMALLLGVEEQLRAE